MKASVVSFALLTALAFTLSGCGPKEDKPPVPKVTSTTPAQSAAHTVSGLPKLGTAPRWELRDVNGSTLTSEQLKGKIVVVDFWATWCGPCRVEIPGYIELTKQYGKDVTVVGVSLDTVATDIVKAFAEKNGINYPIVMADDAVQAAFGPIEAIPTTFLIDRAGQIRDRKQGVQHKDAYEKKIVALLQEQPGT